MDNVHLTSPDALRDRPEHYLTSWSTGESRWLRRFHDADHAEPVYELTASTEDVLKFLTAVLDRHLAFVGTESRIKRIIDTLSDIVVRGSSDPVRRLDHLRAEHGRIEREIAAIESGELVETYGSTAIRERFADAVSDLASLQGDFRAVEESFKAITRDVQRQQAEAADSRGEILGFALDAEDRLKSEDQGVSFDEFVRLILSQSKQEQLETMISQLDEITELSEQIEGMKRVRGMIGSLSAEAEKVLRTTRRLSSTLRRLLDSRSSMARLRLASVLRDIQATAARLAENPPDIGIEVFTELDLLNVSQRTFWESPVQFEEVTLAHNEPDEDERLAAFQSLAEMQRLDWDEMESRINRMLSRHERTTLAALLVDYPPEASAIEVLGYVQLAHDGGHEVDESNPEVIYLADPDAEEGEPQPYEIPRVVFLSERLRSLRALTGAGAE